MKLTSLFYAALSVCLLSTSTTFADEPVTKAFVDGNEPGWLALGEDDFEHVNSNPDTWKFNPDGLIECTGQPVSVIKSKKQYTNFELVCQWRHLKDAGNSGI
ncbi:MAG: family 16 glycoside hydrolase, partial [Pirellulales bacterium]